MNIAKAKYFVLLLFISFICSPSELLKYFSKKLFYFQRQDKTVPAYGDVTFFFFKKIGWKFEEKSRKRHRRGRKTRTVKRELGHWYNQHKCSGSSCLECRPRGRRRQRFRVDGGSKYLKIRRQPFNLPSCSHFSKPVTRIWGTRLGIRHRSRRQTWWLHRRAKCPPHQRASMPFHLQDGCNPISTWHDPRRCVRTKGESLPM